MVCKFTFPFTVLGTFFSKALYYQLLPSSDVPVQYLGFYNHCNDSEASRTLDGGIAEWIRHAKQAASIYTHRYPTNQGKDLQSKMCLCIICFWKKGCNYHISSPSSSDFLLSKKMNNSEKKCRIIYVICSHRIILDYLALRIQPMQQTA